MRVRALLCALAAISIAASCSSPGVEQQPTPDAGVLDASSPEWDAGTPDAGESPDAGPVDALDAGIEDEVDAGSADAGVADAGRGPLSLAPAVPCNDSIDDVYKTPSGLPPLQPENRGDVIRCAPDTVLDIAGVNEQLSKKNVKDITPTTGVNIYRIAYRTTRADGTEGAGTARVYLPTSPRADPAPFVVAAHGSDGIADGCAPSKDPTGQAELTMPFAGTGHAVIGPDYAGLGNEGVQGYLDNRDTGHSTLDAARALRKMLAPGMLSSKVVIAGYSQGGGAALSSQALAKDYGLDGELAAVVVFAAQWQTRLNSFGYIDALRKPDSLTISTGISKPVIYILRQYAYQANNRGMSTVGDGFPAAKRANLVSSIENTCLGPLGAAVQGFAPYVHDLIDDTLRQGLLSCIDGTGCSGDAQALYDYLNANILTADRNGPPVLYVQGLLDTIMLPSEEAACNIEKLQSDGVLPTICTDSGAQHTDILARDVAYAVSWVDATLARQTPPACSSSGMPACSP